MACPAVIAKIRTSLAFPIFLIGADLRVRTEFLQETRPGYGEKIVHALSGKLTAEFGRGFTKTNLFNMVRFAEVFPDMKIAQSLIALLGWTQFLHIIRLDDPLKRDFYAEMCRIKC